jgi:hypothetical protein
VEYLGALSLDLDCFIPEDVLNMGRCAQPCAVDVGIEADDVSSIAGFQEQLQEALL